MADEMSTLIPRAVHGLEFGKNVHGKGGNLSGVRFLKVYSRRTGVYYRKQKIWVAPKTRDSDRPGIRAKAAKQEGSGVGSGDNDGSYLAMWKRAMKRRNSSSFPESSIADDADDEEPEALDRKNKHFEKILQVPDEERDRAQRMQVIDRAAAALAAAKALLAENPPLKQSATMFTSENTSLDVAKSKGEGLVPDKTSSSGILQNGKNTQIFVPSPPQSGSHDHATPGPDFWSWSPPSANDGENMPGLAKFSPEKASNSHGKPAGNVLEKERHSETLAIPFESSILAETTPSADASLIFQSRAVPSLPPLQSLTEVGNIDISELAFDSTIPGKESISEMPIDSTVPQRASEIASVMGHGHAMDANATHGVNPDGSRWWKETGIENRMNGVVCNWTMTRGVSSNGEIEWEEKFWEAYDQFDYKELGSEKSGRDAAGNVWREYWKEAMWQDIKTGLTHIEKSADKWAKNGNNEQWQEKWWEHYDAAGHAEKWAEKWCQIDPNTPLEAGHAHIWHERWGEKYDGKGGAMKYTDKWAERAETENRWTKWGDKWDEHFDEDHHGVRQGETWWEGAAVGDKWNRTWGEEHDGTGWVHKYGKSSSGEHWDTYEEQDTWYERHPHYGFHQCLQNSEELRRVRKYTKPKL